MTKCPRCFRRLPEDTWVFACRSGQCPEYDDPIGSAHSGIATRIGPMHTVRRNPEVKHWRLPADAHLCQTCTQPGVETCPTCHFGLPSEWREGSATCIALAGARATGKSVYIGVMIKQLDFLLSRMGSSLKFATDVSRRIYTEVYQRPLFEVRGIMPPTAAAGVADAYQREPLILSLGVLGGQRRYLVIRDVAGEDLEAGTVGVEHLSYFAEADSVFFMFDPTAVNQVREMLKDLLPPQLHEAGSPETVLENLILLLGPATPPIAMILSKFDTMQALRAVQGTEWSRIMSNPGAAFQRDPGFTALGYDENDGALLDAEVRSLLIRLGAERFLNPMTAPHHGRPFTHRLFAVSALGEAAEGERIHHRGIASFRCLDPVRWTLAANSVL